MNHTLIEKARSLIYSCGLENDLYTEVVYCANNLRNRSLTNTLSYSKTHAEIWFSSKSNLFHLKIVGCFVIFLK